MTFTSSSFRFLSIVEGSVGEGNEFSLDMMAKSLGMCEYVPVCMYVCVCPSHRLLRLLCDPLLWEKKNQKSTWLLSRSHISVWEREVRSLSRND